LGARLRLLCNKGQFVSRLGGDEFAVFCERTDIQQAEMMAFSVLQIFTEPFVIMGLPLHSTASIGIAPVNEPRKGRLSDPLRVADSAMYVAKHKGGNQFSIIESREQAEILRLAIEQEASAKLQATLALKSSVARMKSVMDSTSDGIIEMNRSWVIRYGNRRATEHLERFRVGRSLWACFPGLSSTPNEMKLKEGMSLNKEVAFEHYDDASDKWFRGRLFPSAEGASIFFNNITIERKMQDQITAERLVREKRIEALSHMAGGLAHEISNPLAIIHGKASELKILAENEISIDSESVRTACESILKTSHRASNILRGLRGFAREGGQDPMELASIYEIVDQCLEMQQSRFERNDVEIRLELDPGIPRVMCRQVQVEQILTNLINNAFDAITQSDAVDRWMSIEAHCCLDIINIFVWDSGPGVQDHFRSHLMEAFFTTKEVGLGTGVGLSLSRAIALEHKGTLTFIPGLAHTCFLLTLPLRTDASPPVFTPLLDGVPA
jgi:C4-dicarboxylate-specific signal transduction histidine kinase